MLGRLLLLGSGGNAPQPPNTPSNDAPRPILSLESVQEDTHTRNLLFPDAQALYNPRNDQVFPLSSTPTTPSASTTNAFDYGEDLELDVKDVRILVLQDALGPANASLLFDSHPAPESVTPFDRSPARQRTPATSRKSSLTQTARPLSIYSDGSQSRQGAFDRRTSVHSRTQSFNETEGQRVLREYREELATFSSCIFGNSELMAYKGTSTKVHVVPIDTRANDMASTSSIFGDGRSSIGRSTARSSKLSQSFSTHTVSPTLGSNGPATGNTPRLSDHRKVLITRLFPVNLSPDDIERRPTSHEHPESESGGFPFPSTGDEATPKKKKPHHKQRRTPMYAVVLVVQVPKGSSRISSAAPTKSIFREPGSYNDQEFFSSSYNSNKAGWSLGHSGTYGDAPDSIELEDRIDSLTQHWDIIMRTLTHLQSLVATTLHSMLRQADNASPGQSSGAPSAGVASRANSMSERRGNELPRQKPPKSTTKLVSLWPNCLADDINIASEVGLARSRIVMGLGAARVITGQGRWGIWRDEAIWTSRWAASTERRAFFHNLLTGFLATHMDWLEALAGPSYRRRAATARRNRNDEDLSLPSRTIIVSDDKMAARRLIFLLSAFLPANQQIPTSRAHRPSTSASVGAYSNSPPTYIVPVLREESLRRKINRRTGLRRASHSRNTSQSARNSGMLGQFSQLPVERNHQRRASDAASIRTTNMPMPGNDLVTRKSSAATTTTVVSETTTPHFAGIAQRDLQRRTARRESSGSLAADDLKRSLKRGDSGVQLGPGSRPPSSGLKWGNLVSGLWNPRRRGSMDSGSISQGSDIRSPAKASFPRPEAVSEELPESPLEQARDKKDQRASIDNASRAASTPRDSFSGPVRGRNSFAQADRTPDPTGAFESPVKTSINAEDGVIDVDVPFPDYIASFESAISSPSSSGYLSTPGIPNGLEAFEQARFSIEGEQPLNAAGWLNRFHPDFAIQAVPPQDNLADKVKAALRAEPTPAPANGAGSEQSDRWVDVSSVIMADTTTNTVRRIVYRRLVRPNANQISGGRPGGIGGAAGSGVLLTPSIVPYETQLEEEWIDEHIVGCDEVLKEAVERVIHNSPEASKDSSASSSQAPSDIRGSLESDSTMAQASSSAGTQLGHQSPVDAPRVQCKTVILSTLEDMFREAIERRDDDHLDGAGVVRGSRPKDSLLRDAVRRWVTAMDTIE